MYLPKYFVCKMNVMLFNLRDKQRYTMYIIYYIMYMLYAKLKPYSNYISYKFL